MSVGVCMCVYFCYHNIFLCSMKGAFFVTTNGMEIVETQWVLCIFITFGMDQEHYLDTCYSIQKNGKKEMNRKYIFYREIIMLPIPKNALKHMKNIK